ncbi:hypothetical protein BDN72DRAFT_764370 [Pluteus cervinus]|uniref:Uncharacterized protein n=1 Tax=Pluteus cervinus TaxID=181527 RepID=A0ACD3B0N6_9AGAR|nr:hypothetical protein BDN72DRAFT_764370 [Pluteus cervinus]
MVLEESLAAAPSVLEYKITDDYAKYAIICFGDLLTGERLRSFMESRHEEDDELLRHAHLVYGMGLFHLKMACLDAIWRILIQPKAAHDDKNSLMSHVKQIRPKETGKIETKPGFRRMHEVVLHTGLVARKVAIKDAVAVLNSNWTSLAAWAESGPTWDDICGLSEKLACKFVTPPDLDQTRTLPLADRDGEYENMLIRHDYFLLYEELSYAMNAGDIGRLETCFPTWSFIFTACGKHKYATELMRYLENVHFHYPKGLRNAIRMNILVNPTGLEHKFRAVDWVVEHNNFFIKQVYCGAGSNRTKEHIIKESPLIEVYRNIRMHVEEMFQISGPNTSAHSLPDMTKTFERLEQYMIQHKANMFVPGRVAKYEIPNMKAQGMHTLTEKFRYYETATSANYEQDDENEDDGLGAGIDGAIEPEDLFASD